MNKYSGIRQTIKMPDILSNPSSLNNILHFTQKLICQVQMENQFSRGIHSIYQNLSSNVLKCSSTTQNNFNATSSANVTTCKEIVKILYDMFRHLQQQSFRNLITLKTISKTQKDQPLLRNITDKIQKIKQKNQNYIRLSNNYYSLEQAYIQKSQKFQNVDVKPVKYYSIDAYNDKINKIKEMEIQLQKTLDRLRLEQISIQTMYRQMKSIIGELLYNKIKRIYEIISISREILKQIMKLQDVIIQEGSGYHMTNLSQQSFQDINAATPQQFLDIARSMIEKERNVRQIMEKYIISIRQFISQFKKQRVNSEMSSILVSLTRQKKIISNVIQNNLYYENIDSQEQLKRFCVFLDKLANILQITKFINSYRTMEDELLQQLQIQVKNMTKQYQKNPTSKTRQKQFKQTKTYLKNKYSIQSQKINLKFKEDIALLIKLVKQLRQDFLKQLKPYKKAEQAKIQQQINNIFKSETYKLLFDPFILEQNDYIFKRSPYITEFINIRNIQSNIDNVTVDLSQNSKPVRNKLFNRALCCHSSAKRDVNILDEWICALFDKILLQGKMTLYKKQIKFKSSFNKSTLFGKTKLLIPFKDIIQIEKDEHSINGIFIQTTHGILRFSSFFTNPLPVLKYYCPNKRNTLNKQIPQETPFFPIQQYQQESSKAQKVNFQQSNRGSIINNLKSRVLNFTSQYDNNEESSIRDKSVHQINHQKFQLGSQSMYKSNLRQPNTQDTLIEDMTDNKLRNSRLSFASKMPRKKLSESKININNKQQIKNQQYNPMVLYIILGLVLFILAVIV